MEDSNPYARLGVARDADKKAIKAAYVALIRQFPPETHEAEFKEIRAAYELLSDPEARARYDEQRRDYQELSETESQGLKTAEALEKSGKTKDATVVLYGVLNREPDAHEARFRLGVLLMEQNLFQEALTQFEELRKRRPEMSAARFQLAMTYGALNRHAEAKSELEVAVELKPEELGLRLTLADCCRVLGQPAEADRVLDQADATVTEAMTKLQILEKRIYIRFWRLVQRDVMGNLFYKKEDPYKQPAWESVQQFMKLARSGDAELLDFANRRLGTVAARLFGNGQLDEGNAILSACSQLKPTDPLLHPTPPRIELSWDQVPENLYRWIGEQKGHHILNVRHLVTSGNTFLMMAAAFAVAIVFLRLIGNTFVAADIALWAFMCGTAIHGFQLLGRQQSRTAPQQGFICHPYYLLQALPDRLLLWPWLSLQDVSIRRENNKFTLTLLFRGLGTAFQVWREEDARAWANRIYAWRRPVLESLGNGVLDALPGVEMAPPTSLPLHLVRPNSSSKSTLVIGGVGLILLCYAGYRALHISDWEVTVSHDDRVEWSNWIADHPQGLEHDIADARLKVIEKERRDTLLETTDPQHPGIVALLAAADALPVPHLLPVYSERKDQDMLKELAYVLELHGGYLGMFPIGKDEGPTRLRIAPSAEGWVAEIWNDNKPIFTGKLSGETSEAFTGSLTSVIGLGRLPPVERWQLFRETSHSPYGAPK